MTRKKQKLFKKRVFLNPDEGIAALTGVVVLDETDTWISLSASLELSDCSNSICLDFDVWDSSTTKKFLKTRRRKIKHLRDNILGFLDATEAAYDELEKKLPIKQAAAKAKEKAKEKAKKAKKKR